MSSLNSPLTVDLPERWQLDANSSRHDTRTRANRQQQPSGVANRARSKGQDQESETSREVLLLGSGTCHSFQHELRRGLWMDRDMHEEHR